MKTYSPGLKKWIEVETRDIPGIPTKKKRTQEFIMVPMEWTKRLAGATRANTYRLAHFLLYRAWKNRAHTFPLANKGLEEWGMTRWEKTRALKELEQMGLVAVDRRTRRSPLVTILQP